jgi:hypothetical protein
LRTVIATTSVTSTGSRDKKEGAAIPWHGTEKNRPSDYGRVFGIRNMRNQRAINSVKA